MMKEALYYLAIPAIPVSLNLVWISCTSQSSSSGENSGAGAIACAGLRGKIYIGKNYEN
jgi:hypothetical protein